MRCISLLLIALSAVITLEVPARAAAREALVLDAVKPNDTERATPEAVLSVYTDGRVVVRDPWNPKDEPVEGRIERTRLVKLMSAIVQKLGFMSLTREKMDADVLQAQQRRETPASPETPTATRVRVTWGGETNDITFPALNWHAGRYPESDSLQRLQMAARLLHTLRLETMAGGKKVVDESVSLINKQLQTDDDKERTRQGKKKISTKRVRVQSSDLQTVTREPTRILLKFVHVHKGRQSLRIGATAQVDRETGKIMVLIAAGREMELQERMLPRP